MQVWRLWADLSSEFLMGLFTECSPSSICLICCCSLVFQFQFNVFVSVFCKWTEFQTHPLLEIGSEGSTVYCAMPICFEFLAFSLIQKLVHMFFLFSHFLIFGLLHVFHVLNRWVLIWVHSQFVLSF